MNIESYENLRGARTINENKFYFLFLVLLIIALIYYDSKLNSIIPCLLHKTIQHNYTQIDILYYFSVLIE